MTSQLRIELLGPLGVYWQGRKLPVGAQRLQTLLAVLALRANEVCTPQELFDLVWQDNPPGTGLKVLPPYVYRLRRVLPPDVLDRTPEGYRLRLDDDALDITSFETAVRTATRHRERGELDAAAGEYQRALDLFHGDPLAGLPGQYLAAQRQRLIERRDKVFGDRVDLDLDRGRPAEVIAELIPAVAQRPFDERLAGQLMRALAADGRQAEALDLYSRTRESLIDQLAVEPGPALRAIHQTILRNDEPPQTRDELPYAGATFVGRGAELAQLAEGLGSTGAAVPPIVAIDGMAGAGKTALAVNTARHLASQYPDGLLFVDLHGHTAGRRALDVKAALDHLLTGIGVSGPSIPQTFEKTQALWRTTVAGRRLLVILDNAPDSTTVAPLLPGSPTCGVLITSRNQLTGVDVRDRLHLGLLAADDASALLAQLVGADRAAADVAASNGLIERCGNLPLALRIAGARLRHRPAWTVAHINQRLDRVGRRLTELTADGLGIAAAFQVSYDQLGPDQQRMFRLLSLLPGRDIDQYGAAALADCSPDEAADLAESLVDANLLLEPTPDRYQFHDLIRDYATDLARSTESAADLDRATDRLLEYYLQAGYHPLARRIGSVYLPLGERAAAHLPTLDTVERSRAWADAEASNLAAAVERAAAEGRDTYTWMLALTSERFLRLRGLIQQQGVVLRLAREAARRLADREVEARVLHATGRLTRSYQGSAAAVELYREALELLPADGDPLVRVQLNIGLALCLQALNPFDEALPLFQEATRIARSQNHEALLGMALAATGILYGNAHQFELACQNYEEALTILRKLGPSGVMADALNGLSTSSLELGRADDAIAASTEAYELSLELGNTFSLPYALANLGKSYRLRGDLERAVSAHRQSLEAAERTGGLAAQWTMKLNLGGSLLAIGDADGALVYYKQVLHETTEAKDNLYLLEALEGLADHAAATDDATAAIDYLRQALALADERFPAYATGLRAKLHSLN